MVLGKHTQRFEGMETGQGFVVVAVLHWLVDLSSVPVRLGRL